MDTGMKRCELCSHIARIYCQSDNASLCYNCDQNVHSSNFLVAKHSRTLLCHKCQSQTPWIASGLNLGRAATVCVTCLHEDSSQRRRRCESSQPENDVVEENNNILHEDGETDDDDTESGDESEDEDAENQVVPWSSVASPPVNASSSSEEASSSRFSSDDFRSATKRERLDNYVDSEDDSLCSSERCNGKRSMEIPLTSFRPLKVIRSDRN